MTHRQNIFEDNAFFLRKKGIIVLGKYKHDKHGVRTDYRIRLVFYGDFRTLRQIINAKYFRSAELHDQEVHFWAY